MENSDDWDELQRHGGLRDTVLSEDPPHIRRMVLIACLRSLLYADDVAAKEVAEEDANREAAAKKNENELRTADPNLPSAAAATAATSSDKNDDDDGFVTGDESPRRFNSSNSNNIMTTDSRRVSRASSEMVSTTSSITGMGNRSLSSQAATLTAAPSLPVASSTPLIGDKMDEGASTLFWTITALLRRCESPSCEAQGTPDALRVLGPHNVVLTWISRPLRSTSTTNSSIGPAMTTDDWELAVQCDGCILKSLAAMANVGPPALQPEAQKDLALERRRSAFLLVDVTSWPSWAGSVQYAPWLNLKWHRDGIGGFGGAAETPSEAASATSRSESNTGTAGQQLESSSAPSILLGMNIADKTASLEHVFESSLRSAFESGKAQGLFLLPPNRDSVTMTLDSLIFFGYSCAHKDEPDAIRSALRNPSVYPVLFHRVLPSLRGLELWRNRAVTPQVQEQLVKQRKEREKQLQKAMKKGGETAIRAAAELQLAQEAADVGKPLEWINAIQNNPIPMRHPALCHFSTHAESLQVGNTHRISSSTSSAAAAAASMMMQASLSGGANTGSASPTPRAGDLSNDSLGGGDPYAFSSPAPTAASSTTIAAADSAGADDHGAAMNLLVDAEEAKLRSMCNGAGGGGSLARSSAASFVSLHFFTGNSSLDSVSAWHLTPPRYINVVSLELSRNYMNPGVVSRVLRQLNLRLVRLSLVDCRFSSWGEFFEDVLMNLPKLQSLYMMCCNLGLDDTVVVSAHSPYSTSGGGGGGGGGGGNNYASATGGNTHNNNNASVVNSGGATPNTPNSGANPPRSSSVAAVPSAAAAAAAVLSSSFSGGMQQLFPPVATSTAAAAAATTSTNTLLMAQLTPSSSSGGATFPHRRQHSRTHSSSVPFSSGMMASRRKNTLLRLNRVELRSVPVDAKTLACLFEMAPNISSLLFPPATAKQMSQHNPGDSDVAERLTERLFATLSVNSSRLKELRLFGTAPRGLMQEDDQFVSSFWQNFSTCLTRLELQGWLCGNVLHALAPIKTLEFIDGSSSMELTRSDLFEYCLLPAFRHEHRCFLSLRYLDVSFCHLVARDDVQGTDLVFHHSSSGSPIGALSTPSKQEPSSLPPAHNKNSNNNNNREIEESLTRPAPMLSDSDIIKEIRAKFPPRLTDKERAREGSLLSNHTSEDHNKSSGNLDDAGSCDDVHSNSDSYSDPLDSSMRNRLDALPSDVAAADNGKSTNNNKNNNDNSPPPPALAVLCHRGFRRVPKALLHLEIELLTCYEARHQLKTIDMRSTPMCDEERELVTYQTQGCGVEFLLADPPLEGAAAMAAADAYYGRSTATGTSNNNVAGSGGCGGGGANAAPSSSPSATILSATTDDNKRQSSASTAAAATPATATAPSDKPKEEEKKERKCLVQ